MFSLNRLLDRYVEASLRRERRGVERRQVVSLFAMLGLIVGIQLWTNVIAPRRDVSGWRDVVVTVSVFVWGIAAGAGVLHLAGINKRLTWQRGFRAGREAMLEGIAEASRRGLNFLDWLAGEMQRDGVPIRTELDDEGHVTSIGVLVAKSSDEKGDDDA